jgi:hypothetical protein
MGTKTSKHNPEILDGMAGMAVSNKKNYLPYPRRTVLHLVFFLELQCGAG